MKLKIVARSGDLPTRLPAGMCFTTSERTNTERARIYVLHIPAKTGFLEDAAPNPHAPYSKSIEKVSPTGWGDKDKKAANLFTWSLSVSKKNRNL